MKFQDKFKPGDIICSDRFYGGKCMVVEWGCISIVNKFGYRCQDLVLENQSWIAYEFQSSNPNGYDWRIATDDDIANYLSRFLYIPLGKVGTYDVELTDDGIRLDDGGDCGIYFTAKEIVQLGKIINERVVG